MIWAGIMKKFGVVVAIVLGVAALSAAEVTRTSVSAFSVAIAKNRPQGTRSVSKIMTVVLENTNYDAALRQPFLKSLIRRGALLTNFSAEAHPSQPNYIALVSGSTYGVTSDANLTLDKPQIGDLLEAKGLSWKVYAEGYPGGCFLKAADGDYVRKHVPFLSFKNVQTDQARCARIVDASELQNDLRDGRLPDYSLYVPDLKNDGHDTGVAYADRWLLGMFGPLLQNPRFMRGMLFVVTFDEGRGSFDGNHVATILVGDAVMPGTTSDTGYDHFSLLRLAEDTFGLGSLEQGDARAKTITGIWK